LFESRGAPERRLDVQLQQAGLSHVHTVVLSHDHEDHTGMVSAFAGARLLTGPGLRYESSGPRPFERSHDLFADGCVLLIPGGGHARDDVMALLALPGGPLLLTGDAVVHFSWLESEDVERIAVDPERAADVRNQVRAFVARVPGAVIIPGHDLSRIPRDRADVVLHQRDWFAPAAWRNLNE
jgi:glyoxylase-like metal-dependent hydrolase (beta-lactamase superfamily II)